MEPDEQLTSAIAGHTRLGIDTAPLVYFLAGDAPWDRAVERLLALAAAGNLRLVVSVVTEAELLVGALKLGAQGATTVAELLDGPGIEVVPLSRPMAREAARLRARHGLGLADAVVAATALSSGCTALVGNDRAFRRLGDRLAYLHLDDLTPRRRDTAGP